MGAVRLCEGCCNLSTACARAGQTRGRDSLSELQQCHAEACESTYGWVKPYQLALIANDKRGALVIAQAATQWKTTPGCLPMLC